MYDTINAIYKKMSALFRLLRLPLVLCAVIGGLCVLLIACEEIIPRFVCANGTPIRGTPDGNSNVELCIACNDGYYEDNNTCIANTYTCANGTAHVNGTPGSTNGATFCNECASGYVLDTDDTMCREPRYTCSDGIAVDDPLAGDSDVERCFLCNDGHYLDDTTCIANTYTCANGTAHADGEPGSTNGAIFCARCDPRYTRDTDTNACRRPRYTCMNGVATSGAPDGNSDIEQCDSCADDYILVNADNTCTIDTDGDSVPDVTDNDDDNDTVPDVIDIDDDNDGLIEIDNLDMLHNIRFNPAGTTYDDESDDGDGNLGDTTGAPENPTDNCETATEGFYLCGYELTRSLDFADGASYATGSINNDWRPTTGDPATVTDNPATATNEGWPGIGVDGVDDSDAFTAIFEGNGHTIANLYRRDGDNTGLFNITATGSRIRAIGVVDSALYGDGTDDNAIGALAGTNNGDITASYATGAIHGTDADLEDVGMLVGHNAGTISASYASGNVAGGGGRSTSMTSDDDDIGGLVGANTGTIINSYATSTATGGSESYDAVGGLVGDNGGEIIASYATGAADGGGSGANAVGGLVGYNNSNGTIVASYAIGNATGNQGNDNVGGLVGWNDEGVIIACYATGDAHSGSDGPTDSAGGLVGWNFKGTISASYATGSADSGGGASATVGALLGFDTSGTVSESYGFGMAINGDEFTEQLPDGFTAASATVLQIDDTTESGRADYAGATWNSATSNTFNAWDFGNDMQIPALRYADYDDGGSDFACTDYPTAITCGETLLPLANASMSIISNVHNIQKYILYMPHYA